MDVTAIIDATVAVAILGGVLISLFCLLLLGLGRMASDADDAIEAYVEGHRVLSSEPEPYPIENDRVFDQAARDWIADRRLNSRGRS